MTIKLYTISGAPRGWRVLIGLTLKGLEYKVQYLQASTKEHKQPEFLKINPRGTVPVIECDGVIMNDSIAILAWLDREYPDKPLFGQTNDEAGEIWQLTMECSDYLRDAIDTLFRPILVENITLPKADSEDMKSLLAASKKVQVECTYLESLLGATPFFVGHAPSAAEAVIFPEIRLIKRAIDRKPEIMQELGFGNFNKSYPKLSAWRDRIEALPNMEKAMPHHWNEK
ncbi:glutathione S-transferase family protein [Curvivirga sp.]|uniref:glutathione S-transferase family protein n=1 Tax=Curvivirga sp. TaxID=2856848 RepID=UPI003B5CDE1B